MNYCPFYLNRSKEAVLQALASTVSQVSAPSELKDASVDVDLHLFRWNLHLFVHLNVFIFPFQDPTAYSYQFQDDPYLSPKTTSEFVRITCFNLSASRFHSSKLKSSSHLKKNTAFKTVNKANKFTIFAS